LAAHDVAPGANPAHRAAPASDELVDEIHRSRASARERGALSFGPRRPAPNGPNGRAGHGDFAMARHAGESPRVRRLEENGR
jgi:hypothetical protein